MRRSFDWFFGGILQKNNATFMGIRIGGWDPLKLTFEIMGSLMKKGIIKYEDAVEILKNSLPDEMSPEDKQRIVESLVVKDEKDNNTSTSVDKLDS